MTTVIFPYHRRQHLIRWIADTFVKEGYAAGNSLAYRIGAKMVAELFNAGVPADEVEAAIRKFIMAWQAAAIPRLREQQRQGGAA